MKNRSPCLAILCERLRKHADCELKQPLLKPFLWKHLRARQFDDFKFRRQKPIGRYIVDFVCAGCQVIVELDGETHLDKKDYDAVRDESLKSLGYRVLRFWNNQVYDELESVLEEIYLVCHGKK